MSSDTAMEKHAGGVVTIAHPRVIAVEVAYKGSVHATVLDLLEWVIHAPTSEAPTLKQLSKCTTFVRCTQQFNSVFVK